MAGIRIYTRSSTKEKPYLINFQFLQNREGKQGGEKYVCVCVGGGGVCM